MYVRELFIVQKKKQQNTIYILRYTYANTDSTFNFINLPAANNLLKCMQFFALKLIINFKSSISFF